MSDEFFIPSMSPADEKMPLELYDPVHIALLSVFLTPFFGEWCILQNSKALEDEEGVSHSRGWFAGMIGGAVLVMFLPSFPGSSLLSIAFYLVWFFGSCRPHERWLQTAAPEYIRKSLLKPAAGGCGCLILILLALTVAGSLAALLS